EPPKPSTRISELCRSGLPSRTSEGSSPVPGPARQAGPTSPPTASLAQRQTDHKRLSHVVRGELDWIVMRAVEKDRNRGYETASAFAADVQRYLNDEPVVACPPSAWYRFRKFARRNKSALAVAGLVLFCILSLGGGVGWVLRDRGARQAKAANDLELALE